ncbi:alpha/beta fold hydrolase [Rhodobacterales bacterium HKCCE3408]|nr:alpha/beta fold hydrolase [Rhodobacterales bacterium HKCCE3408]
MHGVAKWSLIAICIGASFLLSDVAARAQDVETECAIVVPPDETLGETFLCGYLEVPEDYSLPDGRTIEIAFVVLKSRSLAPLSDPVIYFQGGPGGSALNSMAQIGSGTAPLRENRDVILFDARGTGHSNDLYCPKSVQVADPETLDANLRAADDRINELGVDAFSDPGEVYEAIANFWQYIDRGRCLELYAGQNIDLRQYNTDNTVLDVVGLMEHLGYPSYNLFGGSYGTTVALGILDHYATTEGDGLPAIRAAVLDSTAPRNREHYEESTIVPNVVLRVFADCVADVACDEAYPAIRQRAINLLEEARHAPIPRRDGSEITVDNLAEVLRAAVTNQQKLVPYLPRLVDELERQETAVYDMARAVMSYALILPDPAPPTRQLSGLAAVQAEIDEIGERFEAIKEDLSLTLLSDSIIRDAIPGSDDRTDLFFGMFDRVLAIGGGMTGSAVVSSLEPFLLHPDQRTRDGLANFVTSTIAFPVIQQEMLSLVSEMSDGEIDGIFARLTELSFARGLGTLDTITNRVVTCNDHGSTIFNDEAFERYLYSEAPELIGTAAWWAANYQISCDQLGLAADAYAPPRPGVVSDVPTLIINAALDTMTPPEWGFRAAETLTNASVVTIPMSGHISGLNTDCGQALVQAFILSPSEDVDRSCADAAKPAFVMPEDPLPQ